MFSMFSFAAVAAWVMPARMPGTLRWITHTRAAPVRGIETVSYTHLDVYKRQVQLAVSSITAYALTGLDVPCKNLIFILILGGMMIPFESTMLANYLFVAQNGLRNQYLGLILPFLLSPAGIFLMRQQFKSIPKEIYDAAAIDGCGPVRLFLRLLLPMSGNALASLAILSMITAWNQYIWPLPVSYTHLLSAGRV